jgi:hypothetical protein
MYNVHCGKSTGPMVLPDQYAVRLTAGGVEYRQPITVKLDPRLKVSQPELADQVTDKNI